MIIAFRYFLVCEDDALAKEKDRAAWRFIRRLQKEAEF